MLEGSCHCGAIRLSIPRAPATVVDCNCSLCRRNGARWAFYDPAELRVEGGAEHAVAYVWGPRSLRTMSCLHCGGTTHWVPLTAESGPKWGVNIRHFDPEVLAAARVRRFDGAVTWTYLED